MKNWPPGAAILVVSGVDGNLHKRSSAVDVREAKEGREPSETTLQDGVCPYLTVDLLSAASEINADGIEGLARRLCTLFVGGPHEYRCGLLPARHSGGGSGSNSLSSQPGSGAAIVTAPQSWQDLDYTSSTGTISTAELT
jgi:hypothetical protein